MAQSTINNMAASGQIRSGVGHNTEGSDIARPTKLTNDKMPPVNSHFHARPSPIIPIPHMDNPIIALVLNGLPGFSPKNVSPINMNTANTIMRALNTLTVHRNPLNG